MATATVGEARLGEHGLKLARRGDFTDPETVVGSYRNDFTSFNDENWTILQDGTQVPLLGDKIGGWLNVPTRSSSAADNDQTIINNEGETFIFNTTDEVIWRARISHTLSAAAEAFALGMSDTVALDAIVDGGATPMTSFDGFLFIKPDSGATGQLDVFSSNATTQVSDTNIQAWADGDTKTLGMYYHPNDGVTGKIIFSIGGTALIRHDITISGLQEMHFFFTTKTGANTQASPGLEVDWVEIIQRTAASVV